MEERMIDDEYGRGVKLRKTKDGYVDVTDEAVDENDESVMDAEEINFEFPTFEAGEGEEDWIGLSPEEVEKRRKEREEEEAKRRLLYDESVQKGQELLAADDLDGAAKAFKKAMKHADEPTEAAVGYWTAKTERFTNPDALIEAYLDSGTESLEFDVGYEGIKTIRDQYGEVFQNRLAELEEEEAPLKEEVEEKQEKRRVYLKERVKKSAIVFGISFLPFVACAILAVVFGLKNFSTPDARYIPVTIGFGVGTLVFLIVFALCMNKFFNNFRLYRKNEKLESTEAGARLAEIALYKELYEFVLTEAEETEEEVDEESEELVSEEAEI